MVILITEKQTIFDYHEGCHTGKAKREAKPALLLMHLHHPALLLPGGVGEAVRGPAVHPSHL